MVTSVYHGDVSILWWRESLWTRWLTDLLSCDASKSVLPVGGGRGDDLRLSTLQCPLTPCVHVCTHAHTQCTCALMNPHTSFGWGRWWTLRESESWQRSCWSRQQSCGGKWAVSEVTKKTSDSRNQSDERITLRRISIVISQSTVQQKNINLVNWWFTSKPSS